MTGPLEAMLWMAAAVAGGLLVYPFTLYPMILWLMPRVALRRPTGPVPRSAALLISARDEAEALPGLIGRLRALKRAWPELDIRIADDGSRDGSHRVLAGARDIARIRRFDRPVGKARALRQLLAGTRAELLILLDANAVAEPAAILRFRDWFRDPQIGAVGATPVAQPAPGAPVSATYWRGEARLKALETATGSAIGCDGALWAVRRALYPDFDPAESDDFRPSVEPLLRGYRVVQAPDIGVAEAEVPDSAGWRRSVRIACGAWHAHRAMAPRLGAMSARDRFAYASHKLVRWFAGLWLAVLGLALGALAARAGHADTVAVLGLALASLVLIGVRPAVALWSGIARCLAVSWGVALAMRGRRMTLWAPVRGRT